MVGTANGLVLQRNKTKPTAEQLRTHMYVRTVQNMYMCVHALVRSGQYMCSICTCTVTAVLIFCCPMRSTRTRSLSMYLRAVRCTHRGTVAEKRRVWGLQEAMGWGGAIKGPVASNNTLIPCSLPQTHCTYITYARTQHDITTQYCCGAVCMPTRPQIQDVRYMLRLTAVAFLEYQVHLVSKPSLQHVVGFVQHNVSVQDTSIKDKVTCHTFVNSHLSHIRQQTLVTPLSRVIYSTHATSATDTKTLSTTRARGYSVQYVRQRMQQQGITRAAGAFSDRHTHLNKESMF